LDRGAHASCAHSHRLYEELCAQARELHALRTQQRVWRLLTTTLRLALPRTPALTSPRLQLAAPPSADETPPRRRRRVVDRKLSRAVAQLRQLCESLSAEAFAQLAPRSVVLILGTSASRPREAYELRLPPLVLEETADSASTVEPPAGHEARGTAVAADVARRVQRCLVQSLVNAPHAPQGALVAPPTLHGPFAVAGALGALLKRCAQASSCLCCFAHHPAMRLRRGRSCRSEPCARRSTSALSRACSALGALADP